MFLSFVLLSLLAAGNANAQVQLDRFFPPVVATGESTTVVAEGKFPSWPVTVESTRDDIQITVGKESGKLELKVPQEAAPGVVWVRLFDSKSASQLVPILVSQFAVTEEKEPNDERRHASPLESPAVVAGRLRTGGDSDCYRITVRKDMPLVVSATAHQVLRSPMDAVLQVTDPRGNVLAQSDDQRGLDPQIVYTPDADQELLIRIFAFPATPNSTVGFGGSPAYVYVLDVTQGPFLDHAATHGTQASSFGYQIKQGAPVKVQKADEFCPPIAYLPDAMGWCFLGKETTDASHYYHEPFDAKLPAVVFGHIRRPKEVHTISFAVNAGTKYRAEVRSKADGFLLDSKLEVIESKSGAVLASNDDVSRGGYDAAVEFTAKSDGTVDLKLTEMLEAFGPRHFYRLSVHPVAPSCKLSVAADRFVLSSDKPLEIPVAVKREFGFSSKVRVEVQGLPEGVTCEPVVSEAKGDTAKSVKLLLKPGQIQSGHHPIRVTASVVDDQSESDSQSEPSEGSVTASFSLRPSIDVKDFWLTLEATDKAKKK